MTWASSNDEFREKAELLAGSLNLYVMSIKNDRPVRLPSHFEEEIEELVSQAQDNPKAILYGTFFTYPFDEA